MSDYISGIVLAIQRSGSARRICERAVLDKERLNETRFTFLVLFMTQLGLGSSDYTLKGSFASVTHSFFALSHPKPSYKPR
jgi:hypothetical protein